ncbi:MAG: CoA transferase [Dehalococcoidia bacterium]|nr:CoA transferase [Dehalococcoidia bacterium]
MESALAGYRVLDCSTGNAGPMAAMYLADNGAGVIKVEPREGEPGRANPGFPLWNRNKRRLACDIRDAAGREELLRWLGGTDVAVFSQPLSELEALGLGPAQLAERFPGLCYLHVPTFLPGCHEEMPESTQLLASVSGAGLYQSATTPVPIDPVVPHLLSMQGIWGAAAVSAALYERERSGRGQVVTVGGMHSVLICLTSQAGFLADIPPVKPGGGPSGGLPNYRIYECADGEWMMLAALTPAFRVSAMVTLEVLEELLSDPRLEGEIAAIGLLENLEWAAGVIARAFKTRTRAEWMAALAEAGVPCGPVWYRHEWLAHPQMDAVNMLVTLDDPERGPVTMPRLPIELSRTPGQVRTAAPSLSDDIAGATWEPRGELPATAGETLGGPLAGIRVLDLGAIVAGTYGASLLADLGADVVKVEPLSGDNLRANGMTFHGYNLGKRSLAMDLRHQAGREVFYRLVRDADVVIDNYRPGVLERLGVDYESLRRINEKIISVSVTGYGTTGPLGAEPGFDPLLQAASGMMRAQGGAGSPVFYTIPINDVGSAATVAVGTILALIHRHRSGEGQRVTTSLLAQSLMMQSSEAVTYAGRPPSPVGGTDFTGPSPLDRYYPVADGWVRLRADNVDSLVAAGVVPAGAPLEGDALAEAITAGLATLTREEAVARLRAAGVEAAITRSLSELPSLDVIQQQGILEWVSPGGRDAWVAGRYADFSRTQRTGPKLPPGLGEHSLEVLQQLAGLNDAEMGRVLQDRIVVQGVPIVFG